MARLDPSGDYPHWPPRLPPGALAHIPGEEGWPIFGTTLKLLADPPAFASSMHAKYGPVYRSKSFGGNSITLLSAEGNELVLFDRDKVFSSEQGWGPMLNRLFPRGLMLMDFEKHRVHRRTLSVAFKPEALRHYADALNAGIGARVAEWSGQDLKFYPTVKALTLDLAAVSFLGIPFGAEAAQVNRAFVDMVQAAISVIRHPLPGTKMRRGVAGRKYLIEYFAREVPKRRNSTGEDIFSQICRATHEDGNVLSDGEIIDHLNFLVMAAHDTITSSMSTLVLMLGRHPEWQDRLREEINGLGINEPNLPHDRLGELTLTDYAFKEAMRLMPPVPSIPRRAVKAFEFDGRQFPAGTFVGINSAFVHKMPEYWPHPETFDPLRFEPEAVRARHKYAWVPFGGGAHMCLGLHFATMQVKILMWHLLREHRIMLAPGSGTKWQAWPIPKPRDGLPVRIERI